MQLGCARVRACIAVDGLDTMQANLTNSARALSGTLEAVDVVGWAGALLEVKRVPSFMDALVDEPQVIKSDTII